MPCARSTAIAHPPPDLHAEIEGPPDAPILVLSHALGLSMGMWDAVRPHLSRLRVVRYDHRGHGVIITGAPHLACVEQPEAIAGQILRWMLSPTS